jgi:hypothetical protein
MKISKHPMMVLGKPKSWNILTVHRCDFVKFFFAGMGGLVVGSTEYQARDRV